MADEFGLTSVVIIMMITIMMFIHGMIDVTNTRSSHSAQASKPDIPKPPLVEFKRAVPPVRRVLIALARRLYQICTTAVADALAGEHLTPLQYAVLAYVEGEADLDQNGLAARLGIDRNSTSLLVEQLEAKRLIERRVNGADRRARLLRITARGQKLYDRLRPLVFSAQERLIASLSAGERGDLLDALVRVVEGNRELARPGAGRRKRGSRQSLSSNS